MAEVLFFHHARGLTSGVVALADELRRAGHTVHTPDLYDGNVFHTSDEGRAYARKVGFEELMEAGVRQADGLPQELVYVGYSLGAMPAQRLAQTRPGARGAILLEGVIPPSEFGDGWPADVPLQIHGMDADPIFAGEGDLEVARGIPGAQLFVYPGDRHVFADNSLPGYDPAAAALLTSRMIDFLASR